MPLSDVQVIQREQIFQQKGARSGYRRIKGKGLDRSIFNPLITRMMTEDISSPFPILFTLGFCQPSWAKSIPSHLSVISFLFLLLFDFWAPSEPSIIISHLIFILPQMPENRASRHGGAEVDRCTLLWRTAQ